MMTSVRIAVALLLPGVLCAEVRLNPLFQDGAVVQAGMPLPVWGTATPNATLSVRFLNQTRPAVADAAGLWRVDLAPVAAGAQGTLTVEGDGHAEARDVVAGEVWLCSGQSNMDGYLHAESDWERTKLATANANLRLFKVGKTLGDTPTNAVSGTWHVCTKPPPGLFSAVGYGFGRDLQARLGVPVGIVQATMGGTLAWGWTPQPALATGVLVRIVEAQWFAETNTFHTLAERAARVSAGTADAKLARADWLPSALYNGMIAPLAPYALRGVVWYQGESDGWRGASYRALLPALIGGWRAAWNRPDLQFLIVQLPRYSVPVPEPMPRSFWAELREAQLLTAQADPHTHLAVTIDLASGTNISIHPLIKPGVVDRLVHLARTRVYGQLGPATGPLYAGSAVEGSRIRVRFTGAESGLVLRPESGDGFAVAGADHAFRWAQVTVDGDTLLVGHPDIDAPAAVRYAWAENPPVSLFNGAGLPASPFRSDDWASASKPLSTYATKEGRP